MAERETLRPSAALAAYVETLLEGRRAIVFGDSSSDLAERLVERGARLVHVYDPDTGRVAEAATRNSSRNISYAPLGEGGLAVREGAFDVALVEDLSAEAEPQGLLRRVKRCLGPRGIALFATRNPDVRTALLPGADQGRLSYYELYDIASAEFEEVRMLGQTPFIGYAVVDFAPDAEPQVSIDSGFVPGGAEEPEYFIALASMRELKLEEFAVIQLSAREALAQRGGSAAARQLEAAVGREKSARGRLEKLETELEALREQLSSVSAEREEQQARLQAAKQQGAQLAKEAAAKDDAARGRRLAELEREVEKRGRWISELEARAAAADERADAIQADLDRSQRKPKEPDPRLNQAEDRARRAGLAAQQAEHERDEARAALARAEKLLRSAAQPSPPRDSARLREQPEREPRPSGNPREQAEAKALTEAKALADAKAQTDARALAEAKELAEAMAASVAKSQAEHEKAKAEREQAKAEREQAQRERDAASRERDELRAALTRLEQQQKQAQAGAERALRAQSEASTSAGRVKELEQELRRAEKSSRDAEQRLAAAERDGGAETLAELQRLEQALRERGAEVRRLERELQVAERFGKRLLAELIELREALPEHDAAAVSVVVVPSSPPAALPGGAPPSDTASDAALATAPTAATETAARAEETAPPTPARPAPDVVVRAAESSSNSGVVSSTAVTVDPAANTARDGATTLRPEEVARVAEQNAQLQADLEAARWAIEELESRLASLAVGETEASLSKQLAAARAELQRKAALIAQLQSTPGSNPAY